MIRKKSKANKAKRYQSSEPKSKFPLPGFTAVVVDAPVVVYGRVLEYRATPVGIYRGESWLQETRLGAYAHLSSAPGYGAGVELHSGPSHPEAHSARFGRQELLRGSRPRSRGFVGLQLDQTRDRELVEGHPGANRVVGRLVHAPIDLRPGRTVPASSGTRWNLRIGLFSLV